MEGRNVTSTVADTMTDRATRTADAPARTDIRKIIRRPGAWELEPRRHLQRMRTIDLALGAGVPLVLVLLWQVSAQRGWIDARLYPPPTDIVAKIDDLVRDRELISHTLISMMRLAVGFGIGASSAIALGLLMGAFRGVRVALEPMLNALYTVPKLALLPVFFTIFGFGEAPILALISVSVFFYAWISTLAALISVPVGYLDAAKVFRATRWQMFRHVLLPSALPEIFVGLRIAAGVAVLAVVGAEFVVGTSGIGYLIEQGRSLLLLQQTYVGIVIIAVVGFLFQAVVQYVGARMTPWRSQNRSAAAM